MRRYIFSIPLAIGFAMLFGEYWPHALLALVVFLGFAVLYGLYVHKLNYPVQNSKEDMIDSKS